MALALDHARAAGAAGDVPVGAVVVLDGQVIGAAGNAKEATVDPTAHAEILTGATLYATLEPCPMCAGALVAARLDRVVFATFDPKAGACGSLYNLCVDPRLNHELEVSSGVRGAEASELLRSWFASRRT
jgi:tRNA(adenine34) deaminase